MGKKSFRKIPDSITAKAAKISGDEVVVGTLLKLTRQQIADGRLSGLGVTDFNDLPVSDESPSTSQGRIARRNADGWTIVRRDLPKIDKIYTFYAPNFGDSSKGEHEIVQVRKVYQRDEFLPPALTVSAKIIESATGVDQVFFIRAQIVQSIDRNDQDTLLFALSLCQETFGDIDVYDINADNIDYLKAVVVDWEILPVGQKDDVIRRLLSPIPGARRQPEMDQERVDFFKKVDPDHYVKGTSGFTRYVGMLFDDLLLLENLSAGNAIYVLRGNWQKLSKLPRRELLKMKSSDVWRVIHNPGWKIRLKSLVQNLIGRDIGG